MAFKSKLEAHKIILNSDKNPSFLKLFTNTVSDDDRALFLDIVQKFFTAVDLSDFHTNHKRKKAFTAYDTLKNDNNEPSILPYPDRFIIQGYLEGGKFGKKRAKSALGEKDKKEALSKKALILDRYYFLLYLPLDSKIGIAIIHSYTSDSIADIFLDFIKDFFSNASRGYKKATTERFFPKSIAEEFEKKSTIKKFTYSTRMVLGRMDEKPITEQKKTFQIKVEAVPDKNLSKDDYPKWLKVIQNSLFKSGDNSKNLADFENGKIYLQHKDTKKETPFEIQKDFKIKPVIYLDDKVKMDEDDVPETNALKEYCFSLLEEIKKEVYPSHAVRER